MLVRIWGSRGSLPVAMNAKTLQEKMVKALVAGAARNLDTKEKARAFLAELTSPCRIPSVGIRPACRSTPAARNTSCAISALARGCSAGNQVLATDGSVSRQR
jgi:hypothetical protein